MSRGVSNSGGAKEKKLNYLFMELKTIIIFKSYYVPGTVKKLFLVDLICVSQESYEGDTIINAT